VLSLRWKRKFRKWFPLPKYFYPK